MELAIVVTILVLLVFGIVEFGLALHRKQSLEAAAREGARIASLGATVDEITQRVLDAQSLFDDGDISVTVSPGGNPPCAAAGFGNTVTVEATVAADPQYGIAIPLWGTRLITYSAVGRFRCEMGAAQ